MNDPRLGLPSASAMARLVNCPGSHAASVGLPEDESEEASSGTRIHAALETGDLSKLSADEMQTALMCQEQAAEIRAAWAENQQGHQVEMRELRLGLTIMGGVVEVKPDTKAKLRFTGQADVIVISDHAALVLDYKTGRGEVEHAMQNDQLRALAVLVSRRWKVQSVRVAIVQPWCGAPAVADYEELRLKAAFEWLLLYLAFVEELEPMIRAGDWCQYCRAKVNCEAFRSLALAPTEPLLVRLPEDPEKARKALYARAMELDPETLAGLVQHRQKLGWLFAAIEGAASARAANDPAFQAYYTLSEGQNRRKVTDVARAWGSLESLGVTPEAFTAECSITLESLKALVAQATGQRGKALDTTLAPILAEVCEVTKTQPQLVAVEGASLN